MFSFRHRGHRTGVHIGAINTARGPLDPLQQRVFTQEVREKCKTGATAGVMLHRHSDNVERSTSERGDNGSDAPTVRIQPSAPRGHASTARCRRRTCMVVVTLIVGLSLWKLATYVLQLFHWAEHRVDRRSHWHAFIFFAVTIPFHLGLPVPLVHPGARTRSWWRR